MSKTAVPSQASSKKTEEADLAEMLNEEASSRYVKGKPAVTQHDVGCLPKPMTDTNQESGLVKEHSQWSIKDI